MKLCILVTTLILASKHLVKVQGTAPSCTQYDGSKGICIKARNCLSAIRLIQLRKTPKICWFEGKESVVCCSDNLTAQIKAKKECDNIAEWSSTKNLYGTTQLDDHKFIVGGLPSKESEFPHMAALGYGSPNDIKWACGGSLISKKFVLTAAHCILTRDLGEVKFVRLGVIDLNNPKQKGSPQDFKVLQTIKHPKYKPPQQYYDIALIKLSATVVTNRYLMPACLQTTKQIDVANWSATGWGRVAFRGDNPDVLQKVDLKEYSVQESSKTYNSKDRRLKNGIVDDSQICAGGLKKDTCQGDSGGPLQYKTDVRKRGFTIIGVTSFGKSCGITNAPSVYSRVSYFLDWIADIVWP